MLLDHVGVRVADRNGGTLPHDLELAVRRDQLAAAVLVTNKALSDLVHFFAVVALALADQLDGVNAEVHVDPGARLQLLTSDEDGLSELLGGGGRFDHFCV